MKALVRLIAGIGVAFAPPAYAAPPVYSDVSGYSVSQPEAGKSYVIVRTEDQQSANPFEFREYAGHIERALSLKGLRRVKDLKQADLAVFVEYAIGDAETQRISRAVPIFGQTGTSSSQTLGHIGPGGTFSANTTNTPSYGITGVVQRTDDITTFKRFLRVTAMDLPTYRATEKLNEAWRVEVRSEGSKGDLRAILPIMAFAASPYMGKDTGKALEVKTKEKSKEYKAFIATPVSGVE